MNEPRPTADTITDEALNALYTELEQLKQSVRDWRTAAGVGITMTDWLRGGLDDVRRAMAEAGLIDATTPDSDASLAELLKQGLDAFWARMQSVDEKADKQLEELADACRKLNAWGEEQQERAERAEAAIARLRTWCDELDAKTRTFTDVPTAEHPIAANIRARLADPAEAS